MVRRIGCYGLLHWHEIFLIFQKLWLIAWSFSCKSQLQKTMHKIVLQINISDRKNSFFEPNFGMVYIISLWLTFCIRDSKAALVLTFGNEPSHDSQASSYAYKMWVWPNGLIRNLKKCAIHQFPIKSVISRTSTKYWKKYNNNESGWSCRTWLLSDWY